jgi:hypothetical protein
MKKENRKLKSKTPKVEQVKQEKGNRVEKKYNNKGKENKNIK